MSEKKYTPEEIEKLLQRHYQAPVPDSTFLDQLDHQMLQAQAAIPVPQKKSRWPDRLPGQRALVPALSLLAVMLVLLFAGPRKVVARIQEMIGYVPGYGFVDLDAVRILPAPVSMTQDGVTMTVKQVIAGPEETIVVIGGEGLPPEEQIGDWDREYYEKYGDFSLYETDARLVLADGTEITDQYFQAAPWDGFFTFPALPAEAIEMVFEMPTIPGIPSQYVPQGWSFRIRLDYVEMPESFNLPEPTSINARAELLEGIEVVVLDAVYASSEVSLRVMLDNLPVGWSTGEMFSLDAELLDDLGNSYNVVYGPNSGRGLDSVFTINFRPIDPRAQRLTLRLNTLFLNLPLEGESIQVDFGENPMIGDTIPVDQVVNVYNIPVRVNTLRLEAGTEMSMDEAPQPFDVTRYVLDIEAPIGDGHVVVNNIEFVQAIHELFPMEVPGGGMSSSGGDPETDAFSRLTAAYWVPATTKLLTGNVTISPEAATLQLNGPFEVSWPIE